MTSTHRTTYEVGKKIVNDETTLEELAKYAEDMGKAELPLSGCQEYLEGVLNSIMYS